VLVITGERRQESDQRACYATVERRSGTQKTAGGRRVDQWRSILEWSEAEVWAIIRRWRVRPHPAYALGFGRVSCQICIYNQADEWATIKAIDPVKFELVA